MERERERKVGRERVSTRDGERDGGLSSLRWEEREGERGTGRERGRL